MSRLVFSPRALQDIERCVEFLIDSDPAAASATNALIVSGLRMLKDHPLVGRPVELAYREMLISRGRNGYIALYKYEVERDIAIVLAIRHQRESGYPD